jgi:hypothetical protein
MRVEARRLDTLEDLVAALDSGDRDEVVTALARTRQVTSYPTTAGVVFGIEFLIPGGPEVEGQAVATTATGRFGWAGNYGGTIPAQGQLCRVTRISGRWVFRHG